MGNKLRQNYHGLTIGRSVGRVSSGRLRAKQSNRPNYELVSVTGELIDSNIKSILMSFAVSSPLAAGLEVGNRRT